MNRRLIALSGLTLAASAVFCAPRADAANDAMTDLLKVLKEQGTITQEAYEQLSGASKADDEANTADAAQVKQAAQTLPKIETKGKLEFATPDGDFSWRLGGRIHVDAAFHDNDDGTTQATDFHSGVDARRARLDLTATLWRAWMFKIQYDFADSGATIDDGLRDAYLRYLYKGAQPFSVTVGQFKEYLGLESLTSSNDITFIERALPSQTFHGKDGRRLGLGVSTYGHDIWTASAGVFGRNASGEDFGGLEAEQSDPLVFMGRLTVSPWHTTNRILHLAFAGSWNSSDDNRVRFRQRPESNVTSVDRLVNTDTFDVDTMVRYGAEAAGVYGPFSMQGEYLRAEVDRHISLNPDVGFDGWYVFGSWIITGESRAYKFEDGVFQNPKPYGIVGKGGIGAWELVARYSTLDLSDEDIIGGEENNVTMGLNWYPTPNFKFMANYVRVLDVKGGGFDGAEPDTFQLRAQAYW